MTNKHTVNNIDKYLDIISQLKGEDSLKHIIFRGQNKEYETVYPSILRNPEYANNETKNIFKHNQQTLKNISFSDSQTIESILIEMQQKGKVPTRLLDVTFNPLVALYNAISDGNDDADGIIYVFKEGVDYFSSNGISEDTKSNFFIKNRAVSALKELYLKIAVGCVSTVDVVYCFMDTLFGLNHMDGFSIDYQMRPFDEWLKMFDNALSKNKFKDIIEPIYKAEPSKKAIHKVLLNLFGFPIFISPHFNQHEQIIANRLILQGSGFLIWPNKIIDNKVFINNIHGEKYSEQLIQIMIPKELKETLREKVSLIYNKNQFYIDTMINLYK